MRALALGLLLTACIDWDAERRAALCLKDQICDAGTGGGIGGGGGGASSGGGSSGGGGTVNGGGSAGGGTQTNGGGTVSTGGGTVANGGGTGQSGGGSSMGGGSSSNGGGTGMVISTDGGCSFDYPMTWCPIPGTNPYTPGSPGHPMIQLADCGGGQACFCASPTGPTYLIGHATLDGGVSVASALPAGPCHGISAVPGKAFTAGFNGSSEVLEQYLPSNGSVSDSTMVAPGTVQVTGLAVLNAMGTDYALGTGNSDAGFGWVDFAAPAVNAFGGDTEPLTPAADFFAPAVLPVGGAIVPYFEPDDINYGAVCGYLVVGANGAVSQPHAYVDTNAEAPAFASTTATSFYVLCSGNTYLHAGNASDFNAADADLLYGTPVGVAALDDLHINAVEAEEGRLTVYTFAWDGGTNLASDYAHVTTEPHAESMTLLSNGQLVISGICIAPGTMCQQVGEAFIGFYNP